MKNLIKKASVLTALTAVTAFAAPVFAAETYNVDPVHSSVVFKIRHFGVYNYGLFTNVTGSVVFDDKNPKKSSVNLTVATDSVYTFNEKRDTHLKSPDFFNSKQFPEITFKSKSVAPKGKDSFEVTGDLTLHGVTKTVKANFVRAGKMKGMKGEIRSGGEAMLKLNRSDFGMTYMPGALGEDVGLTIAIEGILK